MRIRKRWPPPSPLIRPDLPSSRLQPLLSSSSSSSLVAAPSQPKGLLHHSADLAAQHNKRLHPPSDSSNQPLRHSKEQDLHLPDLQLLIVRGENGWVCSNSVRYDEIKEKKKLKKDCGVGAVGGRDEGAEEKKLGATNKGRNGNKPGAETSVRISDFSASSQQVGRWSDGERAFPLKKRKRSFEQKLNQELKMEKDKRMKTKMKPKTKKKWVHEEDSERADRPLNNASSVKNKGNRGVIMEGSRCSRVNGRGWRCCQQTLVGYSLCEHHLGKGRLRSMSCVRSCASTINKPKKEEDDLMISSLQPRSSLLQEDEDEDEDDDDDENYDVEEEEEKPLTIIKKRKKIGMVKARSLSSLLGQPLHEIMK